MRIVICDDNQEIINYLSKKIECGINGFESDVFDVIIDWMSPSDIEKDLVVKNGMEIPIGRTFMEMVGECVKLCIEGC